MNISNVWNSFSTADQQQQVMDALGLSELPDPSTLSQTQLNAIDRVLGTGASVQILTNYTINSLLLKDNDTASNPDLPPPSLGDATDLVGIIMSLQEKLGGLQLKTAKEGVEINKLKLKDMHEEKIEKLKDMLEKLEKSHKSGLFGKIFGWIGVIVGVIAAAVATVATGGAAAPALAIALAGLAIMVLQETGAMDKIMEFLAKNPMMLIILGAVLTPICPAIGGALVVLGALGQSGKLDEDKMKLALNITLGVAMLAASIASMALTGGASAASGISTISRLFNVSKDVALQIANAAKTFGVVAQGVGALSSVGSGAANIAGTVYSYEAAKANADSKEFQAWLAKFQSMLEDEQEQLQKAYEALNQGFAMCSEMFEDIFKSKDKLIGNMGAV